MTTTEPRTAHETYRQLAGTLREQLSERHARAVAAQRAAGARRLYFLSAEYLPGRQLDQNLLALGTEATDVDPLREVEVEAPLGNGGLARLAACVLESAATLDLPVVGYGIRYKLGTFHQAFVDGKLVEQPDDWAFTDNPWELVAAHEHRAVGYGGHTEDDGDPTGLRRRWVPDERVDGEPSTLFIPGCDTESVAPLRLWRAMASRDSLDVDRLESGEYAEAAEEAARAENISLVLYPDEATERGRELRLKQQYFLVSCSLQEIVAGFIEDRLDATGAVRPPSWGAFPAAVTVQLNDTYPALAVVELMRLLVDVHRVPWDTAWAITTKTFGYTVHTLLPEALQTWPVWLMERVLPRHMEIIYSINHFFLQSVAVRFPGDIGQLGALSLIQEGAEQKVRMAYLAAVGAARVNGVAEQHARLLTSGTFAGFARMWPDKFFSVTNGVSPRRFLRLANPRLSALISDYLDGEGWLRDPDRLIELVPLAEDAAFRQAWHDVRRANKQRLDAYARQMTGVGIDPDAMCDVMIKKFHEYKRQLLKALHVVTLYNRILADPGLQVPARTVVFSGKAEPGHHPGKQVMRLVNAIATTVSREPLCADRLRVAFIPAYNVTRAELIIPAADLSEQISMAGMEASGTGNMKLALNGALTVASLDGANLEIRRRVGPDSVATFGMDTAEAAALRTKYEPRSYYEGDPELRAAVDAISSGAFSDGDPEVFAAVVDRIMGWDPYLTLADYRSYVDAQDGIEVAWQDQDRWTRTSILTTARCAHFTSDRTVREYSQRAWHLRAVAPPAAAR